MESDMTGDKCTRPFHNRYDDVKGENNMAHVGMSVDDYMRRAHKLQNEGRKITMTDKEYEQRQLDLRIREFAIDQQIQELERKKQLIVAESEMLRFEKQKQEIAATGEYNTV